MKKLILISALILSVSAAFAQFEISDKPFQIPKEAIVLNDMKLKVKVGQQLIFQTTDNYSFGKSDPDEVLLKKTTQVFKKSKNEEITTIQWIAQKKGECKLFISLNGSQDISYTIIVE